MRRSKRVYPGIHNDEFGGMTDIGKMIRDAWVFGILPETQTCEGWEYSRLEALYDQVFSAWEPYGHLVSRLPDELRERHRRIHDEALARARELGWDAEPRDDD
ncbi:hypothetical protein [Thiohalobacter sp.]|uniref:hypothetical protein n=1 Tax=Thiohalobacter sp. TaxID=2025948 RepID=UPI00260EF0B8|nr:hypothetical protein [Thiohalobacter sp.]